MADQESNISLLFKSIEAEFEAYERIEDPKRAEAKLSLLTSMIRDSKGCASRTGVVFFLVHLVFKSRHLCFFRGTLLRGEFELSLQWVHGKN